MNFPALFFPTTTELRIRCEKRADVHQAFLTFGCILICSKFLAG
jgi:hypothetical protein